MKKETYEKMKSLKNKSLDNLAFEFMMMGMVVTGYDKEGINGWYEDEDGKSELVDIILNKYNGAYSVVEVVY